MRFLFDLLPVVLFFAAYKLADIYVATAVAVIASVAQVAWIWWRERRVERMALVTMALIVVLGGATLVFHDDTFVLWKPTAVNWAFALVFAGSAVIGDKPLIQRMLDEQMELPAAVWRRLNTAWTVFFAALGALNLYVAFHFDRDTWVNFKLFGMLGLTLAFALAQALYLSRHLKPADTEPHAKE